ncbi:MAG: potassium-transporting ATPase subunit KdpB [Alphaproteobacteria bacterium]|nr:potassium-transporting ATPase subunit KdpB [Alphaproteobacteria bacterium]
MTPAQTMTTIFMKLSPRVQMRNPVMFVVYVGAIVTTALSAQTLMMPQTHAHEPQWFTVGICAWLWITVLFANTAEAIAEGRGKAQAESLRALKRDVSAKKLRNAQDRAEYNIVPACNLAKGDLVLVEAGDFVPGDGQVVDGIASVDESAITGESAPVIRESGGDCDAVTGGTRVLSDWLVVKITVNAGESFIDKMVSLVEGAKRQKTPNEIALSILLSSFTLSFLLTIATLLPFSQFSIYINGSGHVVSITMLVALLVCLAPTTIGGLLSAIGIAGMNRLLKANVIASSGRAVEAAGDVNVLLLDKTGTITHGNRQAEEFIPAEYVSVMTLAEAAQLASLADQTPEGKSIVALARIKYNLPEPEHTPEGACFIEFSAETRCSGVEFEKRRVIKGAADAIEAQVKAAGGEISEEMQRKIDNVARMGGTPLVVADGNRVLGVIYLKDIVKMGIKERLADLRKMGIKSIMITGDNPLTAAAIAAEAGVDDYVAQATPEEKLKLIRKMQAGGEMVAMVGDGTNDAPALAQSDVAVVMNSGTQAAKEAGNMVDLDSDPTKLIEVVEIGKQLLMTRGALTTFSIANDVAKYFAIIPAAFASTYPQLGTLNILHLSSPASAMLSAITFNALIIVALVPLALRGVKYTPQNAAGLLRRNLLVYGLGGLLTPFVAIKALDMLLTMMGAV